MNPNKSNPQNPSESAKPGRHKETVPQEIQKEILHLASFYGTREIARRVGRSRKIVRRVLQERGILSPETADSTGGKLDTFRSAIEQRVKKDLTTTRILREIRELGYSGGRTILAEYVRRLRPTLSATKNKPKVKRRFETPPAKEMQIDWSPFRVNIAGKLCVIHILGCLLCSSRKLWLHAYRNERQSTLLEGLASAFEYFLGCALRVVLDNMATAILGRYGTDGKVIWHPRFLDFSRHYGFDPFACAVADPDRKGKKEKSFRLVWEDFLKGTEFESIEDVNQRLMIWLDSTPAVANNRVHGTTGKIPNEQWLSEREYLIQLPQRRFPAYDEGVRIVDEDATVWIEGTSYTVPASLGRRSVAVRLFSEHFEIVGPQGAILYSRRYAPDSQKGTLVINPSHYEQLPRGRRAAATSGRLEDAFLARFPALQPFVAGLRLKMNRLSPIHIRRLLLLCDSYGEQAFLEAVDKAHSYRRYDSRAVERILQRDYPLLEEPPLSPLGGAGTAALGEVEAGSLSDYSALDHKALEPKEKKDDPHGPH